MDIRGEGEICLQEFKGALLERWRAMENSTCGVLQSVRYSTVQQYSVRVETSHRRKGGLRFLFVILRVRSAAQQCWARCKLYSMSARAACNFRCFWPTFAAVVLVDPRHTGSSIYLIYYFEVLIVAHPKYAVPSNAYLLRIVAFQAEFHPSPPPPPTPKWHALEQCYAW